MQSIFVSPFSLQKRIFAAGQVYRWFDSGEPVFIPNCPKSDGRTTCKCLAPLSHEVSKTSREASSAGLLKDGTRPNQGNSPKIFSYLTNSDNACRQSR